MRETFIPTGLVVSLLGNYLTKIIERMKKKKGLLYKDANPRVICHHETLEAVQGAPGEGWRRFPLRASNCWDTSSLTVLR